MGAYASNFHNDSGNIVSELSHPSQPDWITAHATSTGLAVVEVERLWERFQQLGATDDGMLGSEVLKNPQIMSDVFLKNILSTFRSESGNISFQTFLNAMRWAETETLEKKCRAIFHLLNSGGPVNMETLIKVLKRTYPNDSEQSVKRIADVFMAQMDDKNQGFIDEEQFIKWCKDMPAETVSAILEFNIIPKHINEEAHQTFGNDNDPNHTPSSISMQIPTDNMLRQIAEKATRRDWHMLANKLGFTADDITAFEGRNPRDGAEQIYDMLKSWRDREGTQAYGRALEKALQDSSMNDIALLLQP